MNSEAKKKIIEKYLSRLIASQDRTTSETRQIGKRIFIKVVGPSGTFAFTAHHPGQLHKQDFLAPLSMVTGLTIDIRRVGYALIQNMKAFREMRLTKRRRRQKRYRYGAKMQRCETRELAERAKLRDEIKSSFTSSKNSP